MIKFEYDWCLPWYTRFIGNQQSMLCLRRYVLYICVPYTAIEAVENVCHYCTIVTPKENQNSHSLFDKEKKLLVDLMEGTRNASRTFFVLFLLYRSISLCFEHSAYDRLLFISFIQFVSLCEYVAQVVDLNIKQKRNCSFSNLYIYFSSWLKWIKEMENEAFLWNVPFSFANCYVIICI